MITWHETINKSDILGEYQDGEYNSVGEVTGIGSSIGLTEIANSESVSGNVGNSFGEDWFNDEHVSGRTLYDRDGLGIAGNEEGETEGDIISYIVVVGQTENYSNGTQSVTFGGEKFTGFFGGDFDFAGYSTISEEYINTDWSRRTLELSSYELTTLTSLGISTTTTNTNYTVTTANLATTLTTISQGVRTTTSDQNTTISFPTWKTSAFETVLTLGQTTRRRYSRFGNTAPATSTTTFDNASTYINVEETYDVLSFLSLTGYSTTSNTTVVNTVTEFVTDLFYSSNISTEQIVSTTGTSGSTIFFGGNSPFVPSVIPAGGTGFASSRLTTFETNVSISRSREVNSGFFETIETTGYTQQITTINFYPAQVAKTFLTTQSWSNLFLNQKYLSSESGSFINLGFTGTNSYSIRRESYLETIRRPLGNVRVEGFQGQEFVSTHYSVEYACRLNSSDNGGGSYSLPIRALSFAEYTQQAVIPLTGYRTSGSSTYSFYGSRFTATIGNNTETGIISTFGQSTSFYRISSANPQTFTESHYVLGGKQKGEATLANGYYTKYYENGLEETEFLSHPKNISWNNNAEITAYKYLVDYHYDEVVGFPDISNFFLEISTEAWPIPFRGLNIVDG